MLRVAVIDEVEQLAILLALGEIQDVRHALQLLALVARRLARELFRLATNLVLHIWVTQRPTRLPSNVRSL